MCPFSSFSFHSFSPHINLPSIVLYSISLSPCSFFPWLSLLSLLVHKFSLTLNSPSHSHSNLFWFSIPLLHFYHSSLRKLIASSFVLGEQRGTMADWGLSLWQQAWDEREGDKEERQWEQEQAQRGCWLLAGRQGSECWLITLVSMHTAIKPWCTDICRLHSEYPPPATHTHTFFNNIREKEQEREKVEDRQNGGAWEGKKW